MKTDCTSQRLLFGRLGRREVLAEFSGGSLSSDGGALLIGLAEERTRIVRTFVERAMRDHRDQSRVDHSLVELVKQRVFAIALGYEDLNDHDTLRHDALLAACLGKRDPLAKKRRASEAGKPLASSATLNRLELASEDPANDRYKRFEVDLDAAQEFFVDYYVASINQHHGGPGDWVVIDLDPSDIPLSGKQEGRFFHGYYRHYCYLPLYAFAGEHLLSPLLQTADGDGARNAIPVLERIVAKLRQAWPDVGIMVRADSGFCRDALFCWLEENEVDYVIGVARNQRLERAVAKEIRQAKELYEETGEASRLYKDLNYKTLNSWSRRRRVVAKAEYLGKANPRFVATSFATTDLEAWQVYEDEYCPRGEAENRIKEQQLDLFGTRTSCSAMAGNQIRLLFSGLAYLLVQAIRAVGLKGTDLCRAQAGTIRAKLFKIAAAVKVTARKVWVRLSSYCPFAAIFAKARDNLSAHPVLVM